MEIFSIDQWLHKKNSEELYEKGEEWLNELRKYLLIVYQHKVRKCYQFRSNNMNGYVTSIRRLKKSLQGEDLTIHTPMDQRYKYRQEYEKRCQRLLDRYYEPLQRWNKWMVDYHLY